MFQLSYSTVTLREGHGQQVSISNKVWQKSVNVWMQASVEGLFLLAETKPPRVFTLEY